MGRAMSEFLRGPSFFVGEFFIFFGRGEFGVICRNVCAESQFDRHIFKFREGEELNAKTPKRREKSRGFLF
jgi:hypothetical protein